MTRLELKPQIYRTRGKHANHYTTDAIWLYVCTVEHSSNYKITYIVLVLTLNDSISDIKQALCILALRRAPSDEVPSLKKKKKKSNYKLLLQQVGGFPRVLK